MAEQTNTEDWPDELRRDLVANAMNGHVGQTLLSETDAVRVWSIMLQPGARVCFHRHVLNYFWTALTDGVSVSHYSTGETRRTEYSMGTTRHFKFGLGEFMLHDLTNVGAADLAFITVELKASANDPIPL